MKSPGPPWHSVFSVEEPPPGQTEAQSGITWTAFSLSWDYQLNHSALYMIDPHPVDVVFSYSLAVLCLKEGIHMQGQGRFDYMNSLTT